MKPIKLIGLFRCRQTNTLAFFARYEDGEASNDELAVDNKMRVVKQFEPVSQLKRGMIAHPLDLPNIDDEHYARYKTIHIHDPECYSWHTLKDGRWT